MMPSTIIVLAEEHTKAEILSRSLAGEVNWIWVDSLRALTMMDGDAYFDLQFNESRERIHELGRLSGKTVFVSSMLMTSATIGQPFIRINAWPGMLGRSLLELASGDTESANSGLTCLQSLGWKATVAPDIPGFITARIIASVINEAFFTLASEVSTRDDIDTAMKLGTNYPFGPFEWSEKIGLQRVYDLLQTMAGSDSRYAPCPLIQKSLTNAQS